MFQEKDKAAKSTEPVNSRSTDDSAGEPLLTGASTPAIKQDGQVLPTTKMKDIANVQDPSPICSTEGEEKVDNQDIIHINNSNPDKEGTMRTSAATRTSAAKRCSAVTRTRAQTANTMKMKAIMLKTIKTKYGKAGLNSGLIRNGCHIDKE